MLDSDTSDSIDYNEVYSLFTKNDLEDVLIATNKQPMTVKEECEAIEKLRSENFDLKIRFYLLNQDYRDLLAKQLNGGVNGNGLSSKQSSENGSVKNLNTRKESSIKDKEIKVLRTVLEQRVKQLSSLKSYYEEIVRSKDLELEDLRMEKTSAYVTELECNAAALYKIVEQKDSESVELREAIENQKNEIKRLKGDLKSLSSQLLSNQQMNKELSDELESNQRLNDNHKSLTTDTFKLSLEQTRKELDKLKFEMRNQKIIEKEKLDNFAKLLTEREVENDLLKDQIASLKERENYLQKETELLAKDNDLLKENEDQLLGEIKKLQINEGGLRRVNLEYEQKFKEDYLVRKKQHLLKEKNHQFAKPDSPARGNLMDENSNLINGHPAKNSINVQELIKYVKNLEERLDFQEELMRKSELEKQQLKEKKNNLEKIISKQLEKTNNLLKTAKMNFVDK